MKQNQWVAVSISFVLTVTLWLLVTLNTQSYTTNFSVPIKLSNFPNNYQLATEFPKEIQVFTSGIGIKLLYQSFDPIKDTLEVDFEQFGQRGFFIPEKNLRLIDAVLQPGLSSINVEPDTISLRYAVKANKKVAVKLDLEYNIPPSYRVPKELVHYLDSVILIGPEDSIAKFTSIRTKHIKLPPSAEGGTVKIPLDSIGILQTLPSEIELSYTPLPYTEKILNLPIRTVGEPLGLELRIDPETLQVKVLVPLDDFETINTNSVFAVVDYNDIDTRSEYVIPQVRNLPDKGELVAFYPKLCRYLLIIRE